MTRREELGHVLYRALTASYTYPWHMFSAATIEMSWSCFVHDLTKPTWRCAKHSDYLACEFLQSFEMVRSMGSWSDVRQLFAGAWLCQDLKGAAGAYGDIVHPESSIATEMRCHQSWSARSHKSFHASPKRGQRQLLQIRHDRKRSPREDH